MRMKVLFIFACIKFTCNSFALPQVLNNCMIHPMQCTRCTAQHLISIHRKTNVLTKQNQIYQVKIHLCFYTFAHVLFMLKKMSFDMFHIKIAAFAFSFYLYRKLGHCINASFKHREHGPTHYAVRWGKQAELHECISSYQRVEKYLNECQLAHLLFFFKEKQIGVLQYVALLHKLYKVATTDDNTVCLLNILVFSIISYPHRFLVWYQS